jgi:DNA-binding response OmpR family regulator
MARILITDDDSRSRQMLAFFLQLNGHETDEAADGRQAVERFLAHSFDVVLINADMPAMAGWEACERLRQKSQVPIVIVAADGHPSVRGRALMWGANAFLPKPVRLRDLLDWIHLVAWHGNGHLLGPFPSLETSVRNSMARSWGGLT